MAVLNNNRSHPSVHSEGVRDKSVYGTKKFWRFLNSGINSVNKKKFKISRQRAHQIFLRWNFNWSYTPIPTPNNEKDD